MKMFRSPSIAAALLFAFAFVPIAGHASVPASAGAAAPAAAEQVPQDLVRAISLVQQGKMDEALSVLDAYLKSHPNDYRGFVLRGAVYDSRGDYAKAVADFTVALAAKPDLEKTQFMDCTALYNLHRLDEAIQACTNAIALDPNDAGAYDQRALVLDAKDDAAHETSALDDVSRGIAIAPSAWAYAERCELEIELNRYGAATPDCDRSLAMDAMNGWTWFQRAKLAVYAKDFAMAETDLNQAIETHTTIKYVYVSLAQAQYELGKYPDALANVDHYIGENPGISSAYLTRAKIELKMGKRDEAIADAKEALKDAATSNEPQDAPDAQQFLDGLETKP
jgi:tetratricopeptide (TPR) repeat protein